MNTVVTFDDDVQINLVVTFDDDVQINPVVTFDDPIDDNNDQIEQNESSFDPNLDLMTSFLTIQIHSEM